MLKEGEIMPFTVLYSDGAIRVFKECDTWDDVVAFLNENPWLIGNEGCLVLPPEARELAYTPFPETIKE